MGCREAELSTDHSLHSTSKRGEVASTSLTALGTSSSLSVAYLSGWLA